MSTLMTPKKLMELAAIRRMRPSPPLAVEDPVMDRLGKPVTGPDLLSQFRSQETGSFLAQEIDAGDYRGRTVTFRGELRTAQADGRAGLALRVISQSRSRPPQAASQDPREDPANHIASATGTDGWIQHEVTAQIPADADLIRFGVFLNGGGQLEFRHPALTLRRPGQQ